MLILMFIWKWEGQPNPEVDPHICAIDFLRHQSISVERKGIPTMLEQLDVHMNLDASSHHTKRLYLRWTKERNIKAKIIKLL